MKRRWYDPYLGWLGTLAHPDSPAGGSGTGFSRIPKSADLGDEHLSKSTLPRPDSPVGRNITYADVLMCSAQSPIPDPTFLPNYSLVDTLFTPAFPYGVPAGRIPVRERVDPGTNAL